MPTQRRQQLSRDDRIRVLILREAGKSYAEIATILSITQRQVQHTVNAGHPTPKKRSGRPELLSESQKKELIDFVSVNEENNAMSYTALAKGPFSHWNVSEYPIRRALEGAGVKRPSTTADGRRQERERIRRLRPTVTRRHRQNRLKWAQTHCDWSFEQWRRVLWTSEVWVVGMNRNGELKLRRLGDHEDADDEVEPDNGSVQDLGDDRDTIMEDTTMVDPESPSVRAQEGHPDEGTDTLEHRMPTAQMQLQPESLPHNTDQPIPRIDSSRSSTVPGTPTTPALQSTLPPGQPSAMIWSCFYGHTPGPLLVWQDDWGAITQTSYLSRVIPLVVQTSERARAEEPMEPLLRLMQDSTAPYHRSRATVTHLEELRVPLLDDGAKWPAQSPDLNPLVDVWEWISDFVRDESVLATPRNEKELQDLVVRAWQEAVTSERLDILLSEMPQRCRDVVSARGGWTNWWKPRKSRAPTVPPSAIHPPSGLSTISEVGEDSKLTTAHIRRRKQQQQRQAQEAQRAVDRRDGAGISNGNISAPTVSPTHHFPHHVMLNERGIPVAIPIGGPIPIGMTTTPPHPMSIPMPIAHPYPHFSQHLPPPPPPSHPSHISPPPHITTSAPPSGPHTTPSSVNGSTPTSGVHSGHPLSTPPPHGSPAHPGSHHMQIQQRIFSHIQAQFQARAGHPLPIRPAQPPAGDPNLAAQHLLQQQHHHHYQQQQQQQHHQQQQQQYQQQHQQQQHHEQQQLQQQLQHEHQMQQQQPQQHQQPEHPPQQKQQQQEQPPQQEQQQQPSATPEPITGNGLDTQDEARLTRLSPPVEPKVPAPPADNPSSPTPVSVVATAVAATAVVAAACSPSSPKPIPDESPQKERNEKENPPVMRDLAQVNGENDQVIVSPTPPTSKRQESAQPAAVVENKTDINLESDKENVVQKATPLS